MTLTTSRFIGHDQDRGIVQFSMQDGTKEIACAISTSAMDDLERGPRARPSEREAQFTRLRERIEACMDGSIRRRSSRGRRRGSCCGALIFGGRRRADAYFGGSWGLP